MAPLRKPLIGFFSHSLHFGWKGICVSLSPQTAARIALQCCCFFPPPLLFFPLPPSCWPSLYRFPPLPLPRLPLSPHLMRPHNNTAVVQLFCYLSQTAGSLHSVFLVPFTCLLRQGNEYHLQLQSTNPQKGWSVISAYTSEAFGRGGWKYNQSILSAADVIFIFHKHSAQIHHRTQNETHGGLLKRVAVVGSTLARCRYCMSTTPRAPRFKQVSLLPRRPGRLWHNSVWGRPSPRPDK